MAEGDEGREPIRASFDANVFLVLSFVLPLWTWLCQRAEAGIGGQAAKVVSTSEKAHVLVR